MKLKELRQKIGLTQEELAKKIGISRDTYKNYEQHRTEMNYDMLCKISKVLETSIDNILDNEIDDLKNNQEKKNLISIINKLSNIECRKVFNYAEGIIYNRQIETKKSINKLQNEEGE